MELQITGKNVDLVPRARSYIERKMDKLSRHLPDIKEAKVEIAEQKTRSPEHRFVVQVTVNSSGTLLRGEERGGDLFAAIDRVEAVLDRQIEHYKGKRYNKSRKNSINQVESQAETGENTELVTKVKRFAVKPMSVLEAIEQMELLGHSFFLFRNADTEQVNLVYQRKDGNYGLIEPV